MAKYNEPNEEMVQKTYENTGFHPYSRIFYAVGVK